MSDFYSPLQSGDLLLCAKHLSVAARTVWHRRQSSRGERDRVGCSPQCSLTGHRNHGINGVFELVCVVGRGLVSIAEIHAIVAGAQLARVSPRWRAIDLAFWSLMNTPRRCHRDIRSVLRTAARYECVPATFGAGVISLQLIKGPQ